MFENEHTLRRFLTEKAEGQFHDRYEKALESARAEFGSKYPMVINGQRVKISKNTTHISPIDTRVVLGYLPAGTATHSRQAIAAAKKAILIEPPNFASKCFIARVTMHFDRLRGGRVFQPAINGGQECPPSLELTHDDPITLASTPLPTPRCRSLSLSRPTAISKARKFAR